MNQPWCARTPNCHLFAIPNYAIYPLSFLRTQIDMPVSGANWFSIQWQQTLCMCTDIIVYRLILSGTNTHPRAYCAHWERSIIGSLIGSRGLRTHHIALPKKTSRTGRLSSPDLWRCTVWRGGGKSSKQQVFATNTAVFGHENFRFASARQKASSLRFGPDITVYLWLQRPLLACLLYI